MVERFPSGDVIHQQGTGGSPVVRTGNRTERFLTGGVPDLQLDLFAVDGYHAGTELHANRQIVHRLEPFVRELEQQTGFTDTCRKRNGNMKLVEWKY